MGLLENEVSELRQVLADFRNGKMDPDELLNILRVYSQSEKRMRIYNRSLIIGMKVGNKNLDYGFLEEMAGK